MSKWCTSISDRFEVYWAIGSNRILYNGIKLAANNYYHALLIGKHYLVMVSPMVPIIPDILHQHPDLNNSFYVHPSDRSEYISFFQEKVIVANDVLPWNILNSFPFNIFSSFFLFQFITTNFSHKLPKKQNIYFNYYLLTIYSNLFIHIFANSWVIMGI